MQYYIDKLNDMDRTISLHSNQFTEAFREKYADKLVELQDLIDDISSDLKTFESNYIEEPIEEDPHDRYVDNQMNVR